MDFELTDDQASLHDELRRFLAGRVDSDARRAMAEQPGAVDRELWRELGAMGVFAPRRRRRPTAASASAWPKRRSSSRSWAGPRCPARWSPPSLAAAVGGLGIDGAATARRSSAWSRPGTRSLVEHLDGLDVAGGARRRRCGRGRATVGRRPRRRPARPAHPGDAGARCARRGGRSTPRLRSRAQGRLGAAGAALQVGLGTAALELGHRVRQGARAVRPADRLVPGGEAPARRRRGRRRGGPGRGLRRRRSRRRGAAEGHRVDDRPHRGQPGRAHRHQACIQVHGGMGFTWELDAHLFLKRVLVLDQAPGTPADAVDAVAATL